MKEWTEALQGKVLAACQGMYDQDFRSPILPGCARGASEAYFRAQVFKQSEQGIARTYDDPPQRSGVTLWEHTDKIPYKVPGALIFFHYTYDAVAPFTRDGSTGPEDTYTHVGILNRKLANGNWTFWNYRSSTRWSLNSVQEVQGWGWVVPNDYRLPKGYSVPG